MRKLIVLNNINNSCNFHIFNQKKYDEIDKNYDGYIDPMTEYVIQLGYDPDFCYWLLADKITENLTDDFKED